MALVKQHSPKHCAISSKWHTNTTRQQILTRTKHTNYKWHMTHQQCMTDFFLGEIVYLSVFYRKSKLTEFEIIDLFSITKRHEIPIIILYASNINDLQIHGEPDDVKTNIKRINWAYQHIITTKANYVISFDISNISRKTIYERVLKELKCIQ